MRKIKFSVLTMVALLAITFGSCGSKKKITNVSKGYSIEVEEIKKDTKVEETKVTNTVTEKLESKESKLDIETVIEYVFDTSGRVTSSRQTIRDRSHVSTQGRTIDTGRDSMARNETGSSTGFKMSETDTTKIDHSETPPERKKSPFNVLFNWIGVALFIGILLLVIWKFILKR